MEMNDNTILRIKVPAHLYEAVKAQLTLNEAKKGKVNLGAGMEPVKGQKASGGSSDKPKAPKSDKPKASAAPKKEKMEVPKDGMKKATAPKKEAEATKEKKKPSIEEIKKLHEFLGGIIAEMEKSKEPVEEGKQIEEGIKVTSLRDAIMRAMREYKRVTYNGKSLKALGDNDFTTQDGQKISFDSPEAGKLEIDGQFAQDIYDIVEPTPADPKMQGLPDYLRRGGSYPTMAGDRGND
jgi:hypothetical protein